MSAWLLLGILALGLVFGFGLAACKDNIGVNNWPTYGAPTNVALVTGSAGSFTVTFTPAANVPDQYYKAYIRISGTNVIEEIDLTSTTSSGGKVTATGTSTFTYTGTLEFTVGAKNPLTTPSYGNWVAINP